MQLSVAPLRIAFDLFGFMVTVPTTRVSLRLVAERAGVSRMTVSLALRDDPSISAATRRSIQKLAKRLGYRPDPDIARLMERIREKKMLGQQRNVIAYLTAYQERFAWKNEPTQRMYYEGAGKHADECGYHLEEFWLQEPGMTDKRLGEIIRNRGVEGVMVAPLPGPQQLFQEFDWNDFAVVALGYSLQRPTLHRACNHQFQSMLLLAQKLNEMGYRRVGIAMSVDADERVNHHWGAAYLASQSLWGRGHKVPALFMREWNKGEFARWLDRCAPEAVITIGPRVAMWLKELGVRVPEELGLANVDLRPNMIGTTGIDQNSHQVGSAAVDLLISLMRHHERGVPAVPRIAMVEGTFVPGRTVRAAARCGGAMPA